MTGRLAPGGSPGTAMDAIVIWRTLLGKFGPLIGPLSAELLFVRSLAAHASAFPWLPQPSPGTLRPLLADFERSLDSRTPDEILAVNRLLLASYLAVLGELIGPGLVARFLHTAFPHEESGENR